MLAAFISDLKKELSFFTSIRRFDTRDWVHVLTPIALIVLFLYFFKAGKYWFLIAETIAVSLWVWIYFAKKNKIKTIKDAGKVLLRKWKDTDGFLDGEKTQVKWFRKNKIERIKIMLKNSNTELKENACIELLLKECDEKLKETRKSDIVYSRMKPLHVPFSVVFIGLITAYLNNEYVTDTSIEYGSSLLEWAMGIISLLGKDIISNPKTFTLFVVVCGLLVLLYLVAAFIIWPIITMALDRDWIITKEIKESLLYIKHQKYFKLPKDD